MPPHAVVLASSATCPVQAFRVGRNLYATQFHPELDLAGLDTRITRTRPMATSTPPRPTPCAPRVRPSR